MINYSFPFFFWQCVHGLIFPSPSSSGGGSESSSLALKVDSAFRALMEGASVAGSKQWMVGYNHYRHH
jgi:hypothetical protein